MDHKKIDQTRNEIELILSKYNLKEIFNQIDNHKIIEYMKNYYDEIKMLIDKPLNFQLSYIYQKSGFLLDLIIDRKDLETLRDLLISIFNII